MPPDETTDLTRLDPARRDRLLDRLRNLRRALATLGDDLAAGLASLTWHGVARHRFGRLLDRRLGDLAVVVAALDRAIRILVDARNDQSGFDDDPAEGPL